MEFELSDSQKQIRERLPPFVRASVMNIGVAATRKMLIPKNSSRS